MISAPFGKKPIKKDIERFLKDPFFYFVKNHKVEFYFGLISFVLIGALVFHSSGLAQTDSGAGAGSQNSDPFLNQQQVAAAPSSDLSISQDNFIAAVSAPHAVTLQTLGSLQGTDTPVRTQVIDYSVQPGDTVQSVAQNFNISLNTLLWANDLSSKSTLKEGQTLTILPVDGVMHAVKNGDTISDLAKNYKANAADIIAFNNLSNEGDVFVGDVLIIPDGTMPAKPSTYEASGGLATGSWIYPLLRFKETQGLHFFNAVDIASLDGCGAPVFAVAGGVVQRAVGDGGWNFGMGNHITILHPNGVVTYYGHLSAVLVKPGDVVSVGDRLGSEGQTGNATGCHVHFQVMGAPNYIAQRVGVGQMVDVTK